MPPPSPTSTAITANFHRCLPNEGCDVPIKDHCNGLLLLLGGYVVSPTTRQWVVLPPRPPRRNAKELLFRHYDYIVFDPAVSPHYEVLVVPEVPWSDRGTWAAGCQWPPSAMLLQVYSSRANWWEERSFARQGRRSEPSPTCLGPATKDASSTGMDTSRCTTILS
ncbi:hypothetical protein ZWY2020_011647 [Hordeum vulgare]|nr:hypothetical protein ZWY2020_011647 [Hordeum vulgare]